MLALCACGGTNPPRTVGEACDLTVSAFCTREKDCKRTTVEAQCLIASIDACCGKEGLCQREPLNPTGAVACAEAVPRMTCAELDARALPAACIGSTTPRD